MNYYIKETGPYLLGSGGKDLFRQEPELVTSEVFWNTLFESHPDARARADEIKTYLSQSSSHYVQAGGKVFTMKP